MARKLFVFCVAVILTLAAGTAMADSIRGRLGVTGRIGFIVPADSETVSVPGFGIAKIETDTDFIGGGGFIYGVTDDVAAEIDITHAGFSSEVAGFGGPDFGITNITLGAQYRFLNVPVRHLVPYAGVGLDILLNDADLGLDVDNTVGAHLSGGVDYFLQRQLATTAEIKGVLAPDADINDSIGRKVGNFDPSSFSMTFGIRYFFN